MKLTGIRASLNRLLFGLSTVQGKIFNTGIIVLILIAVVLSMLDTLPSIQERWGEQIVEFQRWVLITFAVEYLLRLYASPVRFSYVKSFSGIIDLITVLPLFVGIEGSVLIRLLRLVRVIKVAFYFPVIRALLLSVRGSLHMLFGVLGVIALISVMMGNLVHIIEPETYRDAFEGAWWSLITMSTVGYGDLVPQSAGGRTIAVFLIFSGISMFAMVTAVVSVGVGRLVNAKDKCEQCHLETTVSAKFCHHCGAQQHR